MIRCEELSKSFEEGGGIAGLSLEVKAGETLGILGPTDAGKSTLVRLLMGFCRPDAGSARIFGKGCFDKRHEIQREVAYAAASPAIEPKATGDSWLRFHARYHGAYNPEKARRLSERLDIRLTGRVSSLGEAGRKKLGLMAALMTDAQVTILDEPFYGLDAMEKIALTDLIRERRGEGTAMLITSRLLEEVQRTCSQVAIIRQGRLVLSQPAEALALTRQKVYHITFKDAAQAAAFAAEWETAVEVIGTRVLVAIPASPQILIQTLANYTVLDLVGGREDSEESFLRFHGDDVV
ncbi:MAG: ABC transporter ATP-binding protein [Eubacteriales bacterium]|nr:ABC transporter ATP-binding protein [Eubacteriales bacterium]